MNGALSLEFTDLWLWLIFIGVGLFFVILELIIGVETGLDLVFIGSAFILGGLISWPFHSWIVTVVITSIICVVYVIIGRKYIHRWTAVKAQKTNVDAVIGRQGIVLKSIAKTADGRVRINTEHWKASAKEDIKEGDEIVVVGVNRNTLIVEKTEGGK